MGTQSAVDADYLFIGAFAPVLSLDALTDQLDADGRKRFDIKEESVPEPASAVETDQARIAVRQFVNALPRRDQMIVIRHYWLGESQTEIAADLGVSKMAISKALAKVMRLGREHLVAYRAH